MEKEKRIIQVKCIAYAIVTFVILSFLAFAQIGIINANAEEIEVDQSEQPVPNPYEYTYFDQAYEDKCLGIDKSNFDVEVNPGWDKDSESPAPNGILITGKCGALNKTSVLIDREYDFGTGCPNRVRIDALAKEGTSVFVELYLEGEAEPFATKRINNPEKRDGSEYNTWKQSKPIFIELPNGAVSGAKRVIMKFNDKTTREDKKSKVFLRSIKFYKESVPTVNVNIDEDLGSIAAMNNDDDHQTFCSGKMDVKVPEGFNSGYMEDGETYTGGSYIIEAMRGRGNSTWYNPKKPYKIKLDSKADLFGMGENKHWALLANYYDNTLIRNRLTYYIGETMGMEYTPQLVPVDVVMNGNYLGSYFLSEIVRVDESRVDIDNLEDISEDDDNITGGYLLSVEPYIRDTEYTFRTSRGVKMEVKSPTELPEGSSAKLEDMNAYITDYVQKTEDAIYGEGFKDANGVSYTEYLDLESAVKYFLIQEHTFNSDAYKTTSTYLYKKKDGKLYFGPIWDFDYGAWASYIYLDDNEEYYTSEKINGFKTQFNWFEKLKEDPAFKAEVRKIWGDVNTPGTLAYQLNEVTKEGGVLDQYEKELETSAYNNYDIPNINNFKLNDSNYKDEEQDDFYYAESSNCTNYHEEIERLRTVINVRSKFFDEHMNEDDDWKLQTLAVNYYDGDELVRTDNYSKGDCICEIPELTKEGYYFNGWIYEDDYEENEILYNGKPVYSDMNAHARWKKADESVMPKELILGKKEIYIVKGNFCDLHYTVFPNEAADCVPNVITDKPGVLEVRCEKNRLYIGAATGLSGDVNLTIKFANGVQDTVLIHVLAEKTEDMAKRAIIELDEDTFEMTEGEHKFVEIKSTDGKTEVPYIVVNENPEIAVMDETGVITAKAPGKARSYIQYQLDEYSKCFVNITVNPKGEEASDVVTEETTPSDAASESDVDTNENVKETKQEPKQETVQEPKKETKQETKKEAKNETKQEVKQEATQESNDTLCWKNNEKGWWYVDENGNYPCSKWQKINNTWYYFDADGYMAANEWVDGCWCGADGANSYEGIGSWSHDSNGWWFEDSLGWYPTASWQRINGNWYYFGADGYLLTNCYVGDYWVNSRGICE